MANLDNILSTTSEHKIIFDKTLKEIISCEKPIVREAIGHIIASQGKQVRPILVVLSASLFAEPTQQTYIAASLIELTHCASLIHDDIVDEAYMRRNMLSTYAIWRNKNSILIGDYIFSKAIKIATQNNLFDLLGRIATVIERMSIGELEQSDATLRLDITEEKYYSIIEGKTAELISACTYAGAKTTNQSSEECEYISRFGSLLGMIFQIKDDMLDYSVNLDTGKLTCNDIKEKKITLPLIAALRETDLAERKKVLKQLNKANINPEAEKYVFDFVMKSTGMDYCNQKLQTLVAEAKSMLNKYHDSKYKAALCELIDYFVERNK